jgi:endonuclease/exonuclease/phosphatase (EEP) superfamily protein YafD
MKGRWLRRRADSAAELVCLLVGAATVLGFLGRHWWVAELASHFRVQYFWLLAVAGLVLLLGRRVKWAGVGATLALANLWLIAPAYFPTTQPASKGRPLRVVSINVHTQNQRYEAVLDFIRGQRPDLVLLLEVDRRWAAKLRPLEADYPFSRTVERADNFGMAFYSRLAFESCEVKGAERGFTPTLVVRYAEPSRRWTFIGAHPLPPSSASYAQERNEELNYLAELAGAPHPVLLIGDLNCTPWSPYFQDLLNATRLRDSRRGHGIQATFPTWFAPLLIPIDHCLVSPEIAIHARRIGPNLGSDHLPLIVDFTISND